MADKAKVQDLERSVETLESQMREQIARTRAGATTTLVVGIILLAVLVIVMFSYVNIGEIERAMKPANMIDSVVGLTDVEQKIDSALATAKENLKSDAPKYVAQVRERVVGQIPEAGKRVRALLDGYIDKMADTLKGEATKIMDELYAEHKKELGDFVAALVQKENVEAVEKSLEDALEGLIGPAVDEHMKQFNRSMDEYEAGVKRLIAAKKPLRADEEFYSELAVRLLIGMDNFLQEEEKERMKPPH